LLKYVEDDADDELCNHESRTIGIGNVSCWMVTLTALLILFFNFGGYVDPSEAIFKRLLLVHRLDHHSRNV